MSDSKCPVLPKNFPTHLQDQGRKPAALSLKVLHAVNHAPGFDYAAEFKTLDLEEVKKDLFALMTKSQDWWPADYGHYGPLMIRMAWHSAGTYRVSDGRGGANTGNQRFAPLNSWPDNGNLDKARRLLWPIKKKYGKKLSWADLMVFAGNCAMESMGFKPFGFAGGRVDVWEPEADVYWGPETVMLDEKRYQSELARGAGDESTLEKPLAAVQMGLIYVNPEGPGGKPDPLASAKDIRETFARMAMNDEETVALIAGGHTFGKAHGAAPPDGHVGPAPEDAPIEAQGQGWLNSYKSGKGADTITSGLEGAWTNSPAKWDYNYFENLFGYEWELTKSPAGAQQWQPKGGAAKDAVPDAHLEGVKHAPVMFTTDLALKRDPAYAKISKHFHENPKAFEDAWGRAWYKLTHRDMGPVKRCLGPLVPPAQKWQDPLPKHEGKLIGDADVAALKAALLGQSGLSSAQLVRTAWASASTHRVTDFRGGANGARLRLAPQKDWKVNDPAELAQVLAKLEAVQQAHNAKGGAQVSLADLIVLGGNAAVEAAAKLAGVEVSVPFTPGRTDATQEDTDEASFSHLEPSLGDPFRNYLPVPAGHIYNLVDRAHLLSLTAKEMTVLVGGMRVLDANAAGSQLGVLTHTKGKLDHSFFVNLLDLTTTWAVSKDSEQVYEGKDLATGEVKWRASQVDLVFGSHSELRALSEHYAEDDSGPVFARDFAAAWGKVMGLDQF